ncbi:hypothetical protein AYO22_05623 [Fonsecaea multimorphosa]|nr:hypothetical protein AYO22_05623 [Fonsecaea multimorphosa]
MSYDVRAFETHLDSLDRLTTVALGGVQEESRGASSLVRKDPYQVDMDCGVSARDCGWCVADFSPAQPRLHLRKARFTPVGDYVNASETETTDPKNYDQIIHLPSSITQMAAHHISLAKASFGASLLRPDVTKVSRDDLPTFHNAFEATLTQCSSRNIQTCKQWLLENVVVSPARTSALGKYLVTISRHLANQPDEAIRARVSRQRLHILYLLNDLLHHAKYHEADVALRNNLAHSLQSFLPDLFQICASEAKGRVRRRLFDLIDLWKEEGYFDRQVTDQLHDVLNGVTPESNPTFEAEVQRKSADKELPYLIPSTHGDPSLPFYDLPAGNLMRHIIPNSSQPMRPDEVRALQFSAGPADESLVSALKDFLNDVKGIETTLPRLEQSGLSPEIDELGQISYHDEAGDVEGLGWIVSTFKITKLGSQSKRDTSEAQTSEYFDQWTLQILKVVQPLTSRAQVRQTEKTMESKSQPFTLQKRPIFS